MAVSLVCLQIVDFLIITCLMNSSEGKSGVG